MSGGPSAGPGNNGTSGADGADSPTGTTGGQGAFLPSLTGPSPQVFY